MKKLQPASWKLLVLFLMVFPFNAGAQSPPLVSYQAILRGSGGAPLESTPVTIVFTVRKTSTSGQDVYTETHTTTTNTFGMVNLNLGSGTTQGSFSSIDWAAGPYFLKVDVNGTEMGITQMVSTPYSLYSLKSANGLLGSAPNFYIENAKIGIGTKTPLSTLSVTGSNPLDSAIFEVKNNNGLTVFAVYNEGVRINIDENMKASKGGFAIGGYSGAKATRQEYLRVTGDSTRIYVNNAATAKGAKGGFAIGGYGAAKAPVNNFVSLTSKNSLLGNSAGASITTGIKNFFAGFEAGKLNTTGSYNVFVGDLAGYNNNSNTNIFIGNQSGYTNSTGFGSVIIGDNAGYKSNGSRNIFMGREAGYENTNGMDNVYLGAFSGQKIPSGNFNTFLGVESGNFSTDGWYNVYVGHRAGYISNGSNNVIVGDVAGASNENYLNPASTFSNSVFVGASSGSVQQSGAGNTYIGTYAGRNNLTGSGNVFIGNQAGQTELGSNKLYISNSLTSTPLIYGEFANGDPATQRVRINGKLEVAEITAGAGTYAVFTAAGQLIKLSSSIRYKNDVADLNVDLKDFMALRPVTFTWNNETATPGIKDFGLIAEEVNKIIPAFSIRNSDGSIEGVNYHAVNILTVGIVQEQQRKIKELEVALTGSKDEISVLKEKVTSDELQLQKILEEIASLKKQVRKHQK
jgi:hypothetical protein